MTNQEIRAAAKQKGVMIWQIADALGVHETTLIKRLRHELPEDQQERILAIICRLAEQE